MDIPVLSVITFLSLLSLSLSLPADAKQDGFYQRKSLKRYDTGPPPVEINKPGGKGGEDGAGAAQQSVMELRMPAIHPAKVG